MAKSIDSMKRKGAAVVSNFNQQFTPNTPCFYQPIRGEDKWYPTRTRSEAWMLGHGEPVVKVDGTSGCVCIEHLAMPGSDRYEACIAESEEARCTHNASWVPFPDVEETTSASKPAPAPAAPTRITLVPGKIAYDVMLESREFDRTSSRALGERRTFNETAERLFAAIKEHGVGQVEDGYHTFDELYAHRVRLFSTLMKAHYEHAWWSHKHSDGSQWEGWIIAGIFTPEGMVTYHLPVTEIENLPDGCELPLGREWDGHTAGDVLDRLTSLGGPSGPSGKVAAIKPIDLDEQDELVVYQYAASVNLPQGQIHYDGILTGALITGIEDYQRYRAEIAADANAQVDQVQIHSFTLVGFKAGS